MRLQRSFLLQHIMWSFKAPPIWYSRPGNPVIPYPFPCERVAHMGVISQLRFAKLIQGWPDRVPFSVYHPLTRNGIVCTALPTFGPRPLPSAGAERFPTSLHPSNQPLLLTCAYVLLLCYLLRSMIERHTPGPLIEGRQSPKLGSETRTLRASCLTTSHSSLSDTSRAFGI